MPCYKLNLNMKLLFILSMVIIFSSGVISDTDKDKEDCTQPLIKLAPCLPYVGGNSSAPTPECCTQLRDVIRISKKCLCLVIKDRNDPDLGLNINVTLAFRLPGLCNSHLNASECPALLQLSPNSPDAQFFYQIGNSSPETPPAATTPVAPANPTRGSTSESNAASHFGKTWLRRESIFGVASFWSLSFYL